MRRRISPLLPPTLRMARRACGLGLLLAALGNVAQAGPGGGGGGVPEIDAGSALSALTLITGGILLVTDRIRRGRASG